MNMHDLHALHGETPTVKKAMASQIHEKGKLVTTLVCLIRHPEPLFRCASVVSEEGLDGATKAMRRMLSECQFAWPADVTTEIRSRAEVAQMTKAAREAGGKLIIAS